VKLKTKRGNRRSIKVEKWRWGKIFVRGWGQVAPSFPSFRLPKRIAGQKAFGRVVHPVGRPIYIHGLTGSPSFYYDKNSFSSHAAQLPVDPTMGIDLHSCLRNRPGKGSCPNRQRLMIKNLGVDYGVT
jgi:hypothetical protein